MRSTIAAVAVAASAAVGGLAGAVLDTPTVAGAAQAATDAPSWVQEALRGLVDDGTITPEQADSVETALQDARPHRRFGHHRFGGRTHLSVVADTLGMTEDELRTALEDGQTLADLAGEQGVDVQTVVDALVASHKDRLDQAVAAGDITWEQAEEMLARAEERATALVNGERPAMRGHPHGRR